MRHAVVAKRYAEALFELGEEKNELDTFVKQFQMLGNILSDNEQLFTILKHPQIQTSDKQQLIKDIFKDFNQDVINTIQLLAIRQRIDHTFAIIDQLNELVNNARGIAEATVYSVRPLSDDEQKDLAKKFAKQIHKNSVVFNNIVDPSILGGLSIRVGNTIYDGTVRSKLNRIGRNISTANK